MGVRAIPWPTTKWQRQSWEDGMGSRFHEHRYGLVTAT